MDLKPSILRDVMRVLKRDKGLQLDEILDRVRIISMSPTDLPPAAIAMFHLSKLQELHLIDAFCEEGKINIDTDRYDISTITFYVSSFSEAIEGYLGVDFSIPKAPPFYGSNWMM